MAMRRRPAWRRFLRSTLRVGVIVVLGIPIFVVSAGAVGIATLVYGDLEGTTPKARDKVHLQPSKVYLANPDPVCAAEPVTNPFCYEQVAEFAEFERTAPMQRADVPQVLKDAVVAAEDHQFWSHRGVDPLGIARAANENFTEGSTVQGGSTITQQVVRERYLNRDQTIDRKFNEVLLATRFERQLTIDVEKETGKTGDEAEHEAKERILFDYLDSVYFGAGAYGAQAAAQTYFRKNVRDITAAEAATLVAVIPAPSKFGPRENLSVAEQRRKDVLREMHDLPRTDGSQPADGSQTLLGDAEFEAAMDQNLWNAEFGPSPKPMTIIYPPPVADYVKYPFYMDYIRLHLLEKYGPDMLYHGGLTIIAAIDPHLQELADQKVTDTLSGTAAPLEMSLVTVEPTTGQVKAMVGGRDWRASQVNLALGGSLGMQPGSAFKPFTVAKALEEGYSPDTEYFAPGVYSCGGGCLIHGGTGGIETLRSATAQSVNTYFAQLVLDLGPDNVAELANRLGVTRITLPTKTTPDGHYNLGLTLGAFEVSPLDMAAGFSVFANHGIKPGATPMAKLIDASGKVIEDNTVPHGERVLNAAVADTTAELLRGPIECSCGTAYSAVRLGRMAGGKTGTAQNYKAAWFVGFVPQLSTAVWMGYSDTPKPLVNIKGVGQVFGGTWPARTWNAFMKDALVGVPEIKFPTPGPLPPPSSGIRHIPKDAEIPDFPLDCDGGPCVVTPTLTAPTTEVQLDANGEECGDECPPEKTTTTTRPRTGAPVTTLKPLPKGTP